MESQREDQIEKAHKVSLEASYSNLSHKAISKILPYLKRLKTKDNQLMTYDKAVLAAGYEYSHINLNDGTLSRLPIPENLRNPIVQQSLYEVRHLVKNAIIKIFKNDLISLKLN